MYSDSITNLAASMKGTSHQSVNNSKQSFIKVKGQNDSLNAFFQSEMSGAANQNLSMPTFENTNSMSEFLNKNSFNDMASLELYQAQC